MIFDCKLLGSKTWLPKFSFEERPYSDLEAYLLALAGALQGRNGVSVGEEAWTCNSNPGTITVLTSGTSGLPRVIERSLDLQSYQRRAKSVGLWFNPFRPDKWAFITTFFHVFASGGQMSVPTSFSTSGIADTLVSDQPSNLVMTPSLFNLLATSNPEELAAIEPSLISLGGEAASLSTLSGIRNMWPNVKIAQTYASTEHGDIWAVVSDKPGISRQQFSRNTSLALNEEGELLISGSPTGDFWKEEGDRYVFSHRKARSASVGGLLVDIDEIEAAAQSEGEAKVCRVYVGSRGPFGDVLRLEYFGALSADQLRARIAAVLPKHCIPPVITRVELATIAPTWKGV